MQFLEPEGWLWGCHCAHISLPGPLEIIQCLSSILSPEALTMNGSAGLACGRPPGTV